VLPTVTFTLVFHCPLEGKLLYGSSKLGQAYELPWDATWLVNVTDVDPDFVNVTVHVPVLVPLTSVPTVIVFALVLLVTLVIVTLKLDV